jgi:hypothetical protein
MLYKKEILFEDDEMWNTGETLYAIAKRIGANYSLVWNLAHHKRTVSYTTYLKYRDLVQGVAKKG